jgi:hypothetical protein
VADPPNHSLWLAAVRELPISKQLIAELDARPDEEWIAADEAAAADEGDQAVITVPAHLLPEIRRLLASHKTA